ncbi:MAG: KilA-N domain-containing protein [Nanoarchaeota archaeon]
MKNMINIKGSNIVILSKHDQDFISLTDIAKYKDPERSDYLIQNWLRNKDTIEFLGIWEKINNFNFNSIEFDGFRNRAGTNSFILTPKQWIDKTKAIGIISSPGRYGGTYAHKDIAFEFASWISVEFRLYLIKEFQRLKIEESERLRLGWDVKRELVKINYKIHTDAIKENLIPQEISPKDARIIYASEADVLNKAMFGMTAKEWKDQNPQKEGNLRDYANVSQLVVLANLEALNSEFIKDSIVQEERLIKLNKIAISQMRSLIDNKSVKKLSINSENKKGDYK